MANTPVMSVIQIAKAIEELAERGNILEPTMPAVELAIKLREEADPLLFAEHSRNLFDADIARLIRRQRRKGAAQRHEQFSLFQHLPLRIIGKRHRRVALQNATCEDLRDYCKLLRQRAREMKGKSRKLKEAEALLKRMEHAAKVRPGITVAEVLNLS